MGRRKSKKNLNKLILTLSVAVIFAVASYFGIELEDYIKDISNKYKISYTTSFDLSTIPEFSNEPYVVLNDNKPEFTEEDFNKESFEEYSELDYLGRCGPAFAKVGIDTMPTEERGEIGMVKPSGWKTIKYDSVDGKYLYNRCHLIGYQLTAENANERNLITGTRYMNVQGMLPFENMVAEYVRETKNHVLYRVTPIFEGENLVASGVQIEAKSVEDNGEKICFNVYVYNNQPGITIDYSNGESSLIQ
ncbi:MAG: DNA/RNA non-specific endonuclease [Clostridia bacterium]|nr:DNA/RNA non-specific endonuclease [Clostridia bacterium]